MPLRQAPHPALPPVHEPADLHPESEVFQIRFTGEVFGAYEDYLARLLLYKKPTWVCEVTGKGSLTYEEALRSEAKARQESMDIFPLPGRSEILSLIHYSLLSFNDLVDAIHDKFKDVPMGGEIVTIDGRLARVLDLVPNPIAEAGESNLLEPTASSRSQFGPRQSSFLVTVEAVRSARAKNQPTEPHVSTIPLTKLKRDRLFFTKIAIRKFIREVAFKETRLHAPWIVKPEITKLHGLSDEPTQEVKDFIQKKIDAKAEQEITKKIKPEGAVFPIEDTLLLKPELNYTRIATDHHSALERPMPSYDFGDVPAHLVFSVISSWNFLGIYSKPLTLYPFTFEDYKNAICSPDDLLSEVFAALVAVACREWGQTLPKSADQSSSSGPLEEADTGGIITSSSNENLFGQDGDMSMQDVGVLPASSQKDANELEFDAAYQLLSPDEKVALDQWWKWYPGRWSSADDKNWQGYGASRTRLKAWQVALAGIIRDWITLEECRQKYAILTLLISDHSEERSFSVDQPIEDSPSVGIQEILDDSDDLSAFSDDSNSQQYTFRKRNKSYKPQEFDEEFSDDELTQPVSKGVRKSSRQAEPPRKRETPLPRDTRKAGRQISIESLCQNAEVGFSKISLEDRILLISLLINSCVSTSGKIHAFIDESLEKITELKRERRLIVRERKELTEVRDDYQRKERERLNEWKRSQGSLLYSPVTKSDTYATNTKSDPQPDDDDDEEDEEERLVELDASERSQPLSRYEIRQQRLRDEQVQREDDERIRAEEWDKIKKESKEKQRQFRARQEERKRLDEQKRHLNRRLAFVDQELRIATGSVRVRSIGRDRFLNRYWWFDGAIGAYVPPEANFFDTKGRPRQTKSSVPLDWASGYLFVEEFDVGDRLIEEWDKDSFNSFKEGRESGVWGFFSEPIQLDHFQDWLDPRGVRERGLSANVAKIEEHISGGMVRRTEYVLAKETANPRQKNKNFGYVNRYAA